MNPLALLVVTTAGLVWVGQWISLRARAALGTRPLTPRLDARLVWWAQHRAAVGAACVAVAAGGLVGGVLAG